MSSSQTQTTPHDKCTHDHCHCSHDHSRASSPVPPEKPSGEPSEGKKFWEAAPTCGEAVVDHGAAHMANTSTEFTPSHAMKAVVIRSDRLWDNGTILTYGFMDLPPYGSFQNNQQTKVRNTISQWESYANIKFSPIDDVKTAMIRIAFNRNGGSWSFVGGENTTIKVDQPTMNLGWVDGADTVVSDSERGVILHEFGHALGLMHEHQSPLRGNKITLKPQAVIDFYMETQHWTKADVQAQILDVYNQFQVSNYSELDTSSIMMYFMPAAMNEQGLKIDPNNSLSEIDKAFMTINYPFPSNKQKFTDALNVAGVGGDELANILALFDKKDWNEVRYEFTKWTTEARAARKASQAIAETPKPAADVTLPAILDGCASEDVEGAVRPGGNAQKGVAASDVLLWIPGEQVTYSFVQGSLDVTAYRKKRIAETLAAYASRANLTFQEIPFDPVERSAKIHIYFGGIPFPNVTGWSMFAKEAVGLRRTQTEIDAWGGSVESSIVLTDIVPKVAPTDATAIKREKRTLYHELGHALGLLHEHTSPNTQTFDTPTTNSSVATVFDPESVMLYANKKLRATTLWEQFKECFDPLSTKYNCVPSKMDLAFLGAIYPYGKDHVNNHFDKDIGDLGLTSNLKALSAQRDLAYSHLGQPEFLTHITRLRQMLNTGLSKLVASMAVQQPARDAAPGLPNSPSAVTPPSKPTSGSFLDELIKTLSQLFKPTSGQLFALQFPGRFLQQEQFAWDTSSAGIYGQFVKPIVVNESEFRLVDQLYNVGTVIGAPSGINLSIVYEQVLNNLVPGIKGPQINFAKQQDQIRQWLMKDVPTTGWVKDLIASQHNNATGAASTSGPSGSARAISSSSAVDTASGKPQFSVFNKLTDDKVNRMELAEALMQEYLIAKQAWELERDNIIKNVEGASLNDLTRKLAHITTIREAQLASKHADAVVRGYSHVIRQYMGYMDIKTPAEILQDAKDALRESAMSSLDGSMNVYPIQMQPIDWFKGLSTSFTMEDLTTNPDVILQQIDSKSKQLDTLQTRLAVMQSKPKVDMKELQSRLDTAQDSYDRASADLSTTYTSNVISLARTCINAAGEFKMEDFKKSAQVAKLADAAFDNIEQGMKKLTDAQLAVTQSSRALTQLMAAKSIAEASDTAQEIIETNIQVAAITKDISELTTRLQALRYKPNPSTTPSDPSAPVTLDRIPMYPTESGSSGGSRWQEIYVNHMITTKYTASSDKSSASTKKTDVSLFFGSYHSESSESSATSSSVTEANSLQVEVGFRATMVTVDRGGWFQPQFFKQSAGFHCIDDSISWSKWPENIKSIHDLSTIGSMSPEEATAACEFINKSLLPAFPVGFIVCKDITIKIHMDSTNIQSSGAEMEKFAATSAGILCFSTSSSDHSKSSDKAYGFQQTSDGCVIKIPGPQIMGYMLQFTDKDETTMIPATLPDGFLIPDASYNATFTDKGTTPSQSANAAVPESKDKPAAAAPEPIPKV